MRPRVVACRLHVQSIRLARFTAFLTHRGARGEVRPNSATSAGRIIATSTRRIDSGSWEPSAGPACRELFRQGS